MSKRMPVELNVPRLAGNEAQLNGSIKLKQFKRLVEYLHVDSDDEINARLQFSTGRKPARYIVKGQLAGQVTVDCYRCGNPLALTLDDAFYFAFVHNETEAEQLNEIYDPILLDESGRIRSVDLLEDELILQVPLAPRHENKHDCTGDDWLASDAEHEVETSLNMDQRKNPFDVLKNLT